MLDQLRNYTTVDVDVYIQNKTYFKDFRNIYSYFQALEIFMKDFYLVYKVKIRFLQSTVKLLSCNNGDRKLNLTANC